MKTAKKLDTVQTLVFDYDGTLHDSRPNYILAFKRAYEFLVEEGQAEERIFQDAEITQWLGWSKEEMWSAFMPDLDPFFQKRASQIIGETLLEKVQQKKAHLYPKSLETLAYLKEKGYRLIFLSNCGEYYLEAHRRAFALDRYFDVLLCSESFGGLPKYEIFDRIKSGFPEDYAVIGDRMHDFEVGLHHDSPTIGCSYGCGSEEELAAADIQIDAVEELQTLF